ncbi:MAG: penicillin acylase family protein [Gammaproteobacteria bacterium]|nr:penicillin acylase family protein [Gammaproteobacteria bacterium]
MSSAPTVCLLAVTGCLLIAGCAETETVPEPPSIPGQGIDVGKTVLYRDTWGIAHIYAPTVEAGLYAEGYAQAQDRPVQLLLNLKIAMGELTEVSGEDAIPQDLLSRMFNHFGNSQAAWQDMREVSRARIQAFADGINAFYTAHPQDVPAWWQHDAVAGPMIDAFGRMFLYNWSIDEALEDLRRGGIEPGFATANRGSNQWAVSPGRTASGNAILLIDPHLSWWGPSRFWELRIHAGNLHGSGVSLAGSPYIGLGHNENIAWAMTTGGPDTADIFELTLNPDDPTEYRYENAWRDLEVSFVTLNIKDAGTRTFELQSSHHGPIVATLDGKAYAAAVPYDATTDRNQAWEFLNFAEDYRGAVAACATLSMFPQNVMVADTSGNIYYQRTGRVPVRADGYDWSRPVDGSTAATEYQGIHPSIDHLQILNPPQGYMQNCNVPPDAMMVRSPFQPDFYKDYLFSSASYGSARSGWTNQRGARALELLTANEPVTVAEARRWAVDTKPFGIDRWIEALVEAIRVPNAHVDALVAWNRTLAKASIAALKYAYWRFELHEHEQGAAIRGVIDDHYAQAAGRLADEPELTDRQLEVLAQTFDAAMARMRTELGTTEAPYGRVFRVGRDNRSWPVGGGGGDQWGLTTLRSVGYQQPNDAFERWADRGQTSTQLVVLSKPIQSWIYLPVGQSDRADSPHYDDQAELLFSDRDMKPSWWLPEDLAGNVSSRTVLDYPET